MNNNSKVGRKFSGIPSTHQSGIERLTKPWNDKVNTSLGTVVAVYPDRMTCDIETGAGSLQRNVPVLTSAGLIEGKVFGTLDLPSVESTVIIGFIEGRESYPFIMGTIFPYANNKFQTDQEPVASADKATVLALLENIHENIYRKVFKSGTTIEIKDDGTIQVETPTGTLLEIDEADGGAVNLTVAGYVNITDVDGNIISTSSGGIDLEDTNGNTVAMGTSSVVINGNLEILQ